MKLAIIGTGYVGLVTGACFAEHGNMVTCVDIDADKVKQLQAGNIPIYEPGLGELVTRNNSEGRLSFTTDLAVGIADTEVIFLCLPTPPGEDDSADLHYINEVAEQLGEHLRQYSVIVDKSTVPVGTASKVRELIQKNASVAFDVVANPEFLREGLAIADFMEPDRILIGTSSKKAQQVMGELYDPFTHGGTPILFMDEKSAEMAKYTANAFLAMKVSFMNEIANVSERVGADVEKVRLAIGVDDRIGEKFLRPGPGFGGSCFPKDALALERIARDVNYDFRLMAAVRNINTQQKLVLPEKVKRYFKDGLTGKTFTVWGIAFKPDTDDIREAPALTIINELLKAGAKVQATDPKALANAKKYFKDQSNVTFFGDQYEALIGADALLIVTDWAVYKAPNFVAIKQKLKTPVIFDGRNLYELEQLKGNGIYYESLGRQIVKIEA
ncbi:MAG TPA: UDP-glucose/GDP-mannose dehydrogenase family protein [Candidatus Saccharimonadales bacterium]|nr:UDP-glucose/GDP-mannose dehydrogenase family protein [Candidatus Saccharimonadales bacterium]